jgi:hypothetical protein
VQRGVSPIRPIASTGQDVRKEGYRGRSRDANGSLRGHRAIRSIELPGRRRGDGSCVDDICDITELASRYGLESFDVVIPPRCSSTSATAPRSRT